METKHVHAALAIVFLLSAAVCADSSSQRVCMFLYYHQLIPSNILLTLLLCHGLA